MTTPTAQSPRPGETHLGTVAEPSLSFWQGRSVLVTGHTGFKGSWLCHWLHLLGAEIHGLALDPESGGHYERAGTAKLLASDTRADIRSPESIRQAIE